MNLVHAPHARRWYDEALAARVVTLTGPEVTVVRLRPYAIAGEPDVDQTTWRATAWGTAHRRIPVNTAVSHLLAQLIRDHYREVDWSKAWDYHVATRELLETSRPRRRGDPRAAVKDSA